MENTARDDGTTPANFARFGSVPTLKEIADEKQPRPRAIGLVHNEVFGAYGIKRGFALQSRKLLMTSTDGP